VIAVLATATTEAMPLATLMMR